MYKSLGWFVGGKAQWGLCDCGECFACSFAFCLARSSLVCLRGSRPCRNLRGVVKATAITEEAVVVANDCGL